MGVKIDRHHHELHLVTSLICDFGGSSIEYLIAQDDDIISKDIVPRSEPMQFLKERLSPDLEQIVVTGGSSLTLPDDLEDIPITKIPEFEALARIIPDDSFPAIATSLGTGIPIIRVGQDYSHDHVAGTSIGGGTLMGLGKLLTNRPSLVFEELEVMVSMGDSTRVNLTVGDIIGSGIGMLPAEASASYFAKASGEIEDQIAALFQMVGENLGILLSTVLQAHQLDSCYLAGRLAGSSILTGYVANVLQMRGYQMHILDDPAFACVFQAWHLSRQNR